MQTYSPKILITGGNGQVGTALKNHSLAKNYTIFSFSRSNLDITDALSLDQLLVSHKPDIIINLAAYTAVDKAEEEVDLAMQVNHLGAKVIARLCDKHKIPLIHLSTDYIFDGEKKNAYTEEDEHSPINVYGNSKWLGEEAIRNHCEQHIILRVSSIFSEYGKNFLKTILHLAQTKTEIRIVADQISCPTSANDIAYAIYSIINQLEKLPRFGTYHFCGAREISWYQFASQIIEKAKHQNKFMLKNIHPISAKTFGSLARRPAYSVLNCNKIAKEFGISQCAWDDQLEGIIHAVL